MSCNINSLTLAQIKEVAALAQAFFAPPSASAPASPFVVGKAYLIRTVTMTWIGKVVSDDGRYIALEEAAWVADTGRFHEAVAQGASALNEVEPVGRAFVSHGAVVDAVEWVHGTPLCVK